MHELYELKDKLCKELKEYARKDSLSLSALDEIDKLAHSIKNLDKVIKCEDGDYSYAEDEGSYDSIYVRPDGSYARGRRGNVARDSMGRYSRDGHNMVHRLKEMLHDAPDERTKEELEKFIHKMEKM